MKKLIEKVILRLFPELAGGYHLPMLAIVVNIMDPPPDDKAICTGIRPFYAVDVQLLLPSGLPDTKMPLIRDVPVAMTGSSFDRGFASLPQPGTIVELAFAFGMQDKPFIRSILPYNMRLPIMDSQFDQKWQQNANSYQKVDATGNWKRTTTGDIDDVASMIYIGNTSDNLLKLDSRHMAKLIATLDTLASHTHPHPLGPTEAPNESGTFNSIKSEVTTIKGKLDAFAK